MFRLSVMPVSPSDGASLETLSFDLSAIVGEDVKNNPCIERMPSKQYECVNGSVVANCDTPGIQQRRCDEEPIVQKNCSWWRLVHHLHWTDRLWAVGGVISCSAHSWKALFKTCSMMQSTSYRNEFSIHNYTM